MTTDLPAWETVPESRASFRAWKRVLHHAGKRRAFDLLEPKIRELSAKIRNLQLIGDSSSALPTDRKRKLLEAFDEIRGSRELVHAIELADDPSGFICGVTGIGQHILLAGVCLVQAMLAARNFELGLMGCLTMVYELDADFVRDFGLQLDGRPTMCGR